MDPFSWTLNWGQLRCFWLAKVRNFTNIMIEYCTDKPNFLQFWVKMAKMTLKVKGNYTYLNCKYGHSNSNMRWVITQASHFPKILSQNSQNYLEGQGQWQLFWTANLMIPAQICDELSCRLGQVYRRMNRGIDVYIHRQRQYPFGLKGQSTCIIRLRKDWTDKDNPVKWKILINGDMKQPSPVVVKQWPWWAFLFTVKVGWGTVSSFKILARYYILKATLSL